jgi:peptide/nickel transport system substrate-binding protein
MKKIITIMLAILLIFAAITGCGGVNDVAEELELVIAITRDENTLTPFTYVTGTPGLEVLRLVFDSLFTFDLDGRVIPWMVEDDFTIDDSSRVYTMTLKSGQRWHDGEPLTAEDVKFTFEYAMTQTQMRWRNIASQVERVEISGSEIIITLYEGNPDFLRTGLADMPIIPRHIYEGVENAAHYMEPTIGSSLFALTEYSIGRYYVFEAVEGYFRGTPAVSRINMPIMTDSAAISQAMIAGQISAATRSIEPEVFSVFEAAEGIEILSGRGYAPTMLLFNCEREILNDARFRRALAYALDIETMMNTITLGHATQALPGFITDDQPHAVTELTFEYNPARASMILDDLGFYKTDGVRHHHGAPITFSLLVQSAAPARIRAAELIRVYFEAVGIIVTVESMESDTISALVWPGFDVSQSGDFDMTMWGWSAPVQLDPRAPIRLGMSDPVHGDLNLSGLVDEEFDRLSRMYIDTIDPAERAELSRQLQIRLAELMPLISLWHDTLNFAVNTDHYDGWAFQNTVGVINRFSFLP